MEANNSPFPSLNVSNEKGSIILKIEDIEEKEDEKAPSINKQDDKYDDESILVKRVRVMGSIFWLGNNSTLYDFKTKVKLGVINNDFSIIWN